MRPELSIVMPTFNGARYVGRALDSIAANLRGPIECVVVDDGSTDDTAAIVASYASVLDLRLETGPRQGNWVAATNAGVRLARADHVTLLHQDDEWLPGRMQAVLELMRKAPCASLFLHGAAFISGQGRHLGNWKLPFPGPAGVVEGPAFVERLLVQNFICVDAPVFRRDHFLNAGGMDEELWYTADWDLWLRLAAMGVVAFDARPLVAFRVHGASQTASRSRDLRGFRRQLEVVFEHHFAVWAAAGPGQATSAVEQAGRASIELNVALAGLSHGTVPPVRRVVTSMAALRGRAGRRLLRDSRIHERLSARLRASWPVAARPLRSRWCW